MIVVEPKLIKQQSESQSQGENNWQTVSNNLLITVSCHMSWETQLSGDLFFLPRIYPETFYSKLRHSLWDPGLRSYQQRRDLLCNTTWGIILCKWRPRFQAWHLFIAAPQCRDRSSEFKQAFSLTLRRLPIHFLASFDSYSTLSTSRLAWVSGCIIQTQSNPAPRPSGIADI